MPPGRSEVNTTADESPPSDRPALSPPARFTDQLTSHPARATGDTASERGYPKRPKYFANQFVRLLTKKVVATELGCQAFTLLTVIAMTEDARGYTDPVSYFNGQLQSLVGAGSVDTLDRVRKKCIDAGWLCYTPGAKGRPGYYFVTVPERYAGTDDAATDEEPNAGFVRTGAEACADEPTGEPGFVRTGAEGTRRHVRKEPEDMCGTLLPIPVPVPVAAPAAPRSQVQKPTKGQKPRARNPLFDAIAEVTGADPVVNGSHVGKVAALLSQAVPPYAPAEVREFGQRWRELLSWAKPSEHPRLTLGILEKYLSQLRAAKQAAPAPEPPRIKRAADNALYDPEVLKQDCPPMEVPNGRR